MSNGSDSAVLGFVAGAIVTAAVAFLFFVVLPGGGERQRGNAGVSVEAPATVPRNAVN